jgi:FtsX extracellular domain
VTSGVICRFKSFTEAVDNRNMDPSATLSDGPARESEAHTGRRLRTGVMVLCLLASCAGGRASDVVPSEASNEDRTYVLSLCAAVSQYAMSVAPYLSSTDSSRMEGRIDALIRLTHEFSVSLIAAGSPSSVGPEGVAASIRDAVGDSEWQLRMLGTRPTTWSEAALMSAMAPVLGVVTLVAELSFDAPADVAVYLDEPATSSVVPSLTREIEEIPEVRSVRYQTKEEACAVFLHAFRDPEPGACNQLPASLRVTLTQSGVSASGEVASFLEGRTGVDEVMDIHAAFREPASLIGLRLDPFPALTELSELLQAESACASWRFMS